MSAATGDPVPPLLPSRRTDAASLSPPSGSASALKPRVKQVGPYSLGDNLGHGMFAHVKIATHRRSKEQFAVKIVDKKKIVGEKLQGQVKREVDLMLKLNHPNIIRMVEVLQSDHNVYIVMELVQGADLYDTIKLSKRLDEETARRYFQQLICGLHACHLNGICHRDLKPENLLISADGVLKIVDFGLANLQKPNEHLKTLCGTPNYVSPEVLSGRSYDGFQSDIWSCGCVLYVMLTGRLAFAEKNLHELIRKIKAGLYELPPSVPQDPADLIQNLLVVDPSYRYSLTDIVQHRWFVQGDWQPSALQATGVLDESSLAHSVQSNCSAEAD